MFANTSRPETVASNSCPLACRAVRRASRPADGRRVFEEKSMRKQLINSVRFFMAGK